MISKETLSLIASFQSPILKTLGDVKTEVQFFMDNGLSDYVESIKSKFENTKTFLYRNENVPFYDVFFPVSLKLNNIVKIIDNEEELFKKSNFTSIIGNAGSGKTMLIKHFFLNAVKTGFKIPIFVELRNLNGYDLSIIDYIYQVIFDNKLSPNQKILERLLNTGEFLFLLDGYDEIFSDKKDSLTSDLDRFIDKHSKNNFIITSRPGSGVESLPRFNNFFVSPLNNKEIFTFIDLVLKGNEDNSLAPKIKSVINKPENYDYKNFLNSPLLLSMFILTFNTYPELPRKKSKFYWNVFDTLATKHDSFTKKGGYQHERKTGLQNDELELILKWFSYISLFEGNYSFDAQYLTKTLDDIKKAFGFTYNTQLLIDDFILAIAIIIVDGIEYRFPHKSLQEYFCSSLIRDLSEDKKVKIYSEKFSRQIRLSTGGNENFWNLCFELDKNSFVENFLLYNLNKFINGFIGLSDIEIVKKIYFDSNFSDILFYENGNYAFFDSYSYMSIFGDVFKIIKYVCSFDIGVLSFSNYSNKSAILNFMKEHEQELPLHADDEDRYEAIFCELWDLEFERILVEIGHIKLIMDFIEKIKNKINELRSEITNDTLITDTLLKFD